MNCFITLHLRNASYTVTPTLSFRPRAKPIPTIIHSGVNSMGVPKVWAEGEVISDTVIKKSSLVGTY